MFTLLANTSGLQVPDEENRNLKIYINKSAKLHKVPTPEQSSYEMTMTIFSRLPRLALLNSTFICFFRQWHNN